MFSDVFRNLRYVVWEREDTIRSDGTETELAPLLVTGVDQEGALTSENILPHVWLHGTVIGSAPSRRRSMTNRRC